MYLVIRSVYSPYCRIIGRNTDPNKNKENTTSERERDKKTNRGNARAEPVEENSRVELIASI